MKSRLFMGIVSTILFIGVLTFAFDIQPVKASGTIYIRADGSIEGTTDISTVDNVTYTFTDNIYDEIVVQRSNITLDGAGYLLQGVGSGRGVDLYSSNVTILNVTVRNFEYGIYNVANNNNTTIKVSNITGNANGIYENAIFSSIVGNTLTNNSNCGIHIISTDSNITGNSLVNNGYYGIHFQLGYNHTISNNVIANATTSGIRITTSALNLFIGNTIANNPNGILFSGLEDGSLGNRFYHNNFLNNTNQVNTGGKIYPAFFDNGYPTGGNYWSDYIGNDVHSGPNQDQLGSDGIGETAYIINANNTDNYPLMNPWTPTETTFTWYSLVYPVTIVSNTTIGSIEQQGQNTLSFTATGGGGTGYVLFITPKFTNSKPAVKINGQNLSDPFPTINDNGTHWFIYFEFALSTHNITVYFPDPVGGVSIPVDKLSLLAPYIGIAVLLATAVIAVVYVKKRKKQ